MSDPDSKVSRTVTVVNRKGLHARPSGTISKLAATMDAQIVISHSGHSADARSVMDLLLLIAPTGSALEIEATGPDAQAAVHAIAELVESGFGEPE